MLASASVMLFAMVTGLSPIFRPYTSHSSTPQPKARYMPRRWPWSPGFQDVDNLRGKGAGGEKGGAQAEIGVIQPEHQTPRGRVTGRWLRARTGAA